MAANLSASNWNLINLVKMEDFDINKTINNLFDKRLQDLLSISGVSREELAHRLGVTVPEVNRWLNGVSVPGRVSVPGDRPVFRDAL